MKGIKFRYRISYQDDPNRIETYYFTLEHLESGVLLNFKPFKIHSRDRFTGSYDKNKKEIYEGDIVRAKYRGHFDGVIVYDRTSFKIETEHKDIYGRPYTFLESFLIEGFTVEILGNIYENPEFLKEIRK